MGSQLFVRTVKIMTLEKKNLNHIVLDNIEERKSFLKLEKFLSKSLVLISPTFDDYMTEHRPIKRILMVALVKLCVILFILRLLLSVIFIDNHYISVVLMSDANHILGSKLLISSALMYGHIGGLMLSYFLEYFDLTSRLTVVQYLYEIKNLVVTYGLIEEYRLKYYKKMNFIAKHISWPFLMNMVFNSSLFIIMPPFFGYFLWPEMGFSLLSIILWTPITLIAIFDFNATCLGIYLIIKAIHENYQVYFQIGWGRLVFLSLAYLRYHFKQLNETIEKCIQNKNYYQMRKVLVEHNYCCIKTKELNQTFNYVIFMIYFFAKPVINILVYVSQGKDTPTFTRIAATNITLAMMFIMFTREHPIRFGEHLGSQTTQTYV